MAVAYDPKLPSVIADPYPVFCQLRDGEPLHRSHVLGGVVLTRYADVKACLNDPRLSSDRITPFVKRRRDGEHAAELQELGRMLGLWAVFTDPPKHTQLRGLMNNAFTTRAVERLRPRVETLVAELITQVRGLGQMDLIRDFAWPLPITVIADMLGVPREDRPALKAWSDELAAFVGSALATPDKYGRAARSSAAMSDYFRDLIGKRRASPRDDLLSALVAADERRDMTSDDELVATAILLLFAGHETTTNLIGNGILSLLRHPAELHALRADPSLMAPAIEELLRYEGPTAAMVRIAREDVALPSGTIGRGDRVFLMINAANRDPRNFDEADRVNIRREPNRHIAFGYGLHFCVGAPLARLEAQIAIPALLRHLPELRLTTDALPWLDSLVFRGVRSLPLTFRPA
ncbi:MAG TPA: cytochrome P450 [Methylomirabilota bacterium]|nr:cytochrome P450 [Methylomirabilota bacterium]